MRSRDGWPSYVRLPASRSKYQHVIAEWLSSRAAEPSGAKSKTAASERIVDELIGAYLDFAKTYYVKNGAVTGEYRNIGDALRPLTYLYGRTRMADFSPSALKAVRQAMIDANLCRRTINCHINCIRHVFKWGVENEFVQPRFFTRYKPSHRCPPENGVGDGVGKRCCGWRRPVLGLRVSEVK